MPLVTSGSAVGFQKDFPHQPMALHFFIEGTTWKLEFLQYRLYVALVPGQRITQALRLEGFHLLIEGKVRR